MRNHLGIFPFSFLSIFSCPRPYIFCGGCNSKNIKSIWEWKTPRSKNSEGYTSPLNEAPLSNLAGQTLYWFFSLLFCSQESNSIKVVYELLSSPSTCVSMHLMLINIMKLWKLRKWADFHPDPRLATEWNTHGTDLKSTDKALKTEQTLEL